MKNFSRRILLALAILVLSISTFGGTVVSALADLVIVEPTQKPANIYTEETYLSYDSEMEYAIPVRMSYYGECIASYQMGIDVPDFLTVVDVTCDNFYEETTSFIVEKTLSGFRVSFTTQYEAFSGDAVLFNVICKTNRPGEYWGEFMISGDFTTMFVSETAREIPYICEFSGIGVSSEGFDSVITGDLNLDGVVTLADVICLQRYILGNCDGMPSNIFNAGDIDKDGNLDSVDVQYMQMYLVGAIPSLDNIGGENGDGDEGWGDEENFKDPRYLSVSILDKREQLVTYQTFTAEKGTLYPAVVGDFVTEILNRYSANVVRVQSDAYGEMTTAQAEKAVLDLSDCVFIYLDVIIEDYNDDPTREVVQDTYLEVETNYRIRIVLYSDYTVELYDNGELFEKGKYNYNESQYDISVILSNGYKFRASYNKVEDCYFVTGGDNYDEPDGNYVYLPCYYLANGNYLEVGGGRTEIPDGETKIYEYVANYHPYGETVTIDAVYTDDTFTETVPLDANFVVGETYYIVIKDVQIVDATFVLYQQRVTITGQISVEEVGVLKVTSDTATIIYKGETAGKSYPYGIMLGQMEIRTGDYSQILVAISGDQAIIAWEYDGSMNEVNEVYSKYEGVYEMTAFSAPMPYTVTLYNNGVVKINAGGDINIMDTYFLEGDQITFSMMGNVIKGTVDIDNKVIICSSMGGDSGGSGTVDKGIIEMNTINLDGILYELALFSDYTFEIREYGETVIIGEFKPYGNGYQLNFEGRSMIIVYNEYNGYYEIDDGNSSGNDYDKPITHSVILYVEFDDGKVYEIDELYDYPMYATVGEIIDYIERTLPGLDVVAMYDCNGNVLVGSDAFNEDYYYCQVMQSDASGSYSLVADDYEKYGKITLTATEAIVSDLNGNSKTYSYKQFLNYIEVVMGEYEQLCLTLYEEYAWIEQYFNGNDYEIDESLNDLVGVYNLSDDFEPAMQIVIYNNGICKIETVREEVGSFRTYTVTDKGILVDMGEGELAEFVYNPYTEMYEVYDYYYDNGYDNDFGYDNDYSESGTGDGYIEDELKEVVQTPIETPIGGIIYN